MALKKAKKSKLTPDSGVKIGLTGGIGTGKSYVRNCFKKLGFATFCADAIVHEVLKRKGEAFEIVGNLFPDTITASGIDRKALGQRVLGYPELLKKLEDILHPIVRKKQEEFIESNKGNSLVIDIPLLLENKREKEFDVVIVTTASKKIQEKRVLARKNMTKEKFDAILEHQVSDDFRFAKADYIVDTSGTQAETFKIIKELVSESTKRDST